jgi:hypothetical protein
MNSTTNSLRSPRIVLMRNRRSLLVLLTYWALIAFIAWGGPSDITGNYYAGFKAGCVFVLVVFGVLATIQLIVRVIRQAVYR